MKIITRSALKRVTLLTVILALSVAGGYMIMLRMPGKSYSGPLPALTNDETRLCDALRRDVQKLAGDIGERNVYRPKQYQEAADFLETSLREAGYETVRQSFTAMGFTCVNLIAEVRGEKVPDEIIVVGAHYDSVFNCPGANDNGTGVAGVLALARAFANRRPARTIRFAFFANEEPPHFQTPLMGSLVYARQCRQSRENIIAMISLETIGYFTDLPRSQRYPFPLSLFYPSTGNFIGFVGNLDSRELVRQAVAIFRRSAQFPSEGGALPSMLPGIGWSDHWAFWRQGYPAIMVTDTAPFRYPYYHKAKDTPDKLDYPRLARVVSGLEKVVVELGNTRPTGSHLHIPHST
ncbi:MAG: M28 family peptidase [Candidatus Omnitrophica bacterium]|nr:M28 family peptidase [Candidatus Omnitrophota bacterium]